MVALISSLRTCLAQWFQICSPLNITSGMKGIPSRGNLNLLIIIWLPFVHLSQVVCDSRGCRAPVSDCWGCCRGCTRLGRGSRHGGLSAVAPLGTWVPAWLDLDLPVAFCHQMSEWETKQIHRWGRAGCIPCGGQIREGKHWSKQKQLQIAELGDAI